MIRFDVPGVGGSPAPLLPYHYAMLASLVGALVRRLGHDRVDVLGFSWGGGLAQQFAVTQARKCRRLVLAATGTGAVMVPARPRVLGHMLTPRRHRDPAYTRRIAGELYGGTMRTHPERAAQALHAHAGAGSTRGYLYQLLAIAGWTSLHALTPHPAAHARAVRRRRPAHPDRSTPGSSPAGSRTRACTCTGAATWPS